METMIVKPSSLLFEMTTQDEYEKAFAELARMRRAYPQYRDDDLLMVLLCWYMSRRENVR